MHPPCIDQTGIQRFRVGPLASCVDAYLARAKQESFSAFTVVEHLRVIRRFSIWLHDAHIEMKDLDEGIVQSFVARRKNGAYKRERAILDRVIVTLRAAGVLSDVAQSHSTVEDQLMRDFGQYLARERGLSNATIVNYDWAARGLWAVCSERGCTDCSGLLPSDLTTFVQQQARRMPPERARLLVTGLRSFLGYLRHRGEISSDLSASIPAVANWALSTLPRSLPAGAAQQVIGHCHPTSPIEKRNYGSYCCWRGWA